MELKTLNPTRDVGLWKDLYDRSATDATAFRGFRSQNLKLFRGDYEVLTRRTKLTRYGLTDKDGALRALAIHFRCSDPKLGPSSALGGILVDPKLPSGEVRAFAREVAAAAGPGTLAPFNGHMNLGLSHPAPGTKGGDISFMCAAGGSQLDRMFGDSGAFVPDRTLYALSTPITPDLKKRLVETETEAKDRGFSTRPVSLLNFKKELSIYTGLLNEAMAKHPHFFPLTLNEEREVWSGAALVVQPSLFRFLMHEGREIGFCLAFPDYNQHLDPQSGDVMNGLAIQAARIRGSYQRARLVYSIILPEFQGQGLIKMVRHSVINQMADRGVDKFESSYVDEANAASLGNVRSTGGHVSHTFNLYRTT